MEVYRITLKEFSDKLFAPGFKGRWNEDGQFVIYTASSRSLACLENLVHRNEIPAELIFATMAIHIPDDVAIQAISLEELPTDWLKDKGDMYSACLELGSEWYSRKDSLVLKVPSAVIPMEWNYVINARHKDFEKVSLVRQEPFYFDERLGIIFSEEKSPPLKINK
jgi:RES domain-containing protein